MAPQGDTRRSFLSRLPLFSGRVKGEGAAGHDSSEEELRTPSGAPKWSFGVLNDKATVEVPGSVLLLSDHKNEPLGLHNAPARTSHSSLPTGPHHERVPPKVQEVDDKKKTEDGKIILEPQPEDSANDPLNWPTWRRDAALLSLGLHCMVGGGMTPVLAAGFSNVASDYGVPVARVSLTTGLFMMGLGIGSVFASPTAILWGKRPVYLMSAVLFIGTSAWCAASPSFTSLMAARVVQGVSVSPVECLPSATIAEIYFLHERAFRIGIYTLLLLGGKNLTPLISAAIIQSLSWRWVFWVVALIVAFSGALLFLFVPETFWDRTPIPRSRTSTRPSMFHRISSKWSHRGKLPDAETDKHETPPQPRPVEPNKHVISPQPKPVEPNKHVTSPQPRPERPHKDVRFATGSLPEVDSQDRIPKEEHHVKFSSVPEKAADYTMGSPESPESPESKLHQHEIEVSYEPNPAIPASPANEKNDQLPAIVRVAQPDGGLSSLSSVALTSQDEFKTVTPTLVTPGALTSQDEFKTAGTPSIRSLHLPWSPRETAEEKQAALAKRNAYTGHWRNREAKSFVQQLRPWHGRLNNDEWLKVAIRPFILYTYPSVLWSAAIYSCSVGWLIVVSESVTVIYRQDYYHFNALQTGLMYVSPFIGGVLGTAVAGKVSDVIVKAMARRNGGLYEPEFRLVMAIPVAITTLIGLLGYGWSAQVRDNWIVPTVFLGIISFGCSLGSTTAITFCVDSYRQYAGEALVTLNFSKNIFHGLVFSFFVTGWIENDGAKDVFIWIGVIQMIALVFTIPMFIYGKRARMWTVRKNLMEKF